MPGHYAYAWRTKAISQNAYPSYPSPSWGRGAFNWRPPPPTQSRGTVGMGGRGEERLSVPCAPLAPSPSPIKGEGIEEGESFPEIA